MNGQLNTGREALVAKAVLTPDFNAQTIFADDVTIAERIQMARELFGEQSESDGKCANSPSPYTRFRSIGLSRTVRPLRRAA